MNFMPTVGLSLVPGAGFLHWDWQELSLQMVLTRPRWNYSKEVLPFWKFCAGHHQCCHRKGSLWWQYWCSVGERWWRTWWTWSYLCWHNSPGSILPNLEHPCVKMRPFRKQSGRHFSWQQCKDIPYSCSLNFGMFGGGCWVGWGPHNYIVPIGDFSVTGRSMRQSFLVGETN